MSKQYSDHSKPSTNLIDFLPEVHRSDVNKTVFDVALNRHLTKDDTVRVAGTIGESNPNSSADRQIKEITPHRQAYQLAPTMVTKVGTVETAMSYKAFQSQLELMGVDVDRLPLWGNTKQFNWAPPINIDMLVNYQDYFWNPINPQSSPQYLTIENRCTKATSKVSSYNELVSQRGSSFNITNFDYVSNNFIVSDYMSDLFITGFLFFTNSSAAGIANKFWTVVKSEYDINSNTTAINVKEQIATVSVTAPPTPNTNDLWYNTTVDRVSQWDGSNWVAIQQPTAAISLTELGAIYQLDTNCACNQEAGFDTAGWDDGQLLPSSTSLWSTSVLASISKPSANAWVEANGVPNRTNNAQYKIWFDTTKNVLNEYDFTSSTWKLVVSNFSAVAALSVGNARWDATLGCDTQISTKWSTSNRWIHRSQVQTYPSARRATLPILEYSSSAELNTWSKRTFAWKYRSLHDHTFASVGVQPKRFELEPIKGFVVRNVSNVWTIYLHQSNTQVNQHIDYTDTFVPGFSFRITNDLTLSQIYTVERAEYREILVTDDVAIDVGSNQMVTVITLIDSTYGGPLTSIDLNARIVPIFTSRGDAWTGYHIHWLLDEQNTSISPSANHVVNLFNTRDTDSITTIANISTPQFLPHYATIQLGSTFQQFTVQTDLKTVLAGSISQDRVPVEIVLNSAFQSTNGNNVYASLGGNELRVYINGVRQIGTYTEVYTDPRSVETLIGMNTSVTSSVRFVHGIKFTVPVVPYSIIRIEVGSASFNDMGLYSVPVRTIENESAFAIAVASGAEPKYIGLTQNLHYEQAKTTANQYPLFNVYDIVTSDVIKASPIFGYREDPTQPVNIAVNRRIVVGPNSKEFEFEQFLVSEDNGKLYGYRHIVNIPLHWFNPITNIVRFWNGSSWTTNIIVTLNSGAIATRIAAASAIDPATRSTLEGDLWIQPITQTLRQRVGGQWVTVSTLIVTPTDPLLRTVWRHGPADYIPQYVNSNKQPVQVGDINGDWELLSQWKYNPEHHNNKVLKYSQLITHFTSMIKAQPRIPGLLAGGTFTMSQEDYNYGVGGTIKEHNDSFDTLIAAINVTNTTPTNVIEFASQQYASSLTAIRQSFTRLAPKYVGQYAQFAQTSLSSSVSYALIDKVQNNDFLSQVFGDTSAYDPATNKGIKNWVSTTAMFGLARKTVPHLTVTTGSISLMHHDGHRSTVVLTSGEQDRLAKAIVTTSDYRGSTVGVIKSTAHPSLRSEFISQYGYDLRNGAFWYQVTRTSRTLYKFVAYDISTQVPALTDINGNLLPEGTTYYNLILDCVLTKQHDIWVQLSTPGDISSLWQEVSFSQLLGDVLLEVEQRLYDVTPDRTQLAFDFESLKLEPNVYNKLLKQQFMQYVSEHKISAPLLNLEYTPSNPFTWNYGACIPITAPNNETVSPAGAWQSLYTNYYGTPYPHVEPWKLQGFYDKPTWWDNEYLDTSGARTWIYSSSTSIGMWENIRVGRIPAGRTNPDGSISDGSNGIAKTYRYFSVNISDVILSGGYKPDSLLPPYYDIAQTLNVLSRSLFTSYTNEIIAPDADYSFGSMGPTEWKWSVSLQHQYDFSIIAFKMQPVRFMHYAFGVVYTTVDGLQLDMRSSNVNSHSNVAFHGDVYGVNDIYETRGLSQWYVNLNRYNGFDTNSEFRSLWADWTPTLTYQFGGIVDTSTVDLANRYSDLIDQDYRILLANNGVIRDLWADSLNISLINIPPAIIQYNNQNQWRMEIDTVASIAHSIKYYGVKSYTFTANVQTNECTVFEYPIGSVSISANRVTVAGDLTNVFYATSSILLIDTAQHTFSYTVQSSTFDITQNNTRIIVTESMIGAPSVGKIQSLSALPSWITGDLIVLASSKFLPNPFETNTPYYVIVTGSRTFKIAETSDQAINEISFDISNIGSGLHNVSQIESSFNVYGGQGNTGDLWFHYALDKNVVHTFTPPQIVNGMQSFINVIDGYAAVQRDSGLLTGTPDSNDFDPLTGRIMDWSLETERFIDWAFGLRNINMVTMDSFPILIDTHSVVINIQNSTISAVKTGWTAGLPVRLGANAPLPLVEDTLYYLIATSSSDVFQLGSSASPLMPITFLPIASSSDAPLVSVTSDRLRFTEIQPTWKSGTEVVFNSSGTLPEPIIIGSSYYVILTGTPGYIRLSTSSYTTDTSAFVQFASNSIGRLSLALRDVERTFPSLELNPTRNNIWIDTPLGILADVVKGPYTDIRVQQTVYDQYNRLLGSDRISVYREDKRSHITVIPQIRNDIDINFVNDPYNYIHMGGGHFFTEGYEHFLLFNNSTVDGLLIYDPFLGLNITRFDIDYFEKADYTLRPTLGGFYLLDGKFERNMEGSISDMRNYYDTYGLSESSDVAKRARGLLGYDGKMLFMDKLNTTKKSKFLFYKGMIETKGSLNSVNAFINSRRFIDAKLDEFWAYKIAEFGDARPRFYPRIKLMSTDAIASDIRLKFVSLYDAVDPVETALVKHNGFELISFTDEARWDALPEQRASITSSLFLDGEITKVVTLCFGSQPPASSNTEVTYFYNVNTNKMFKRDGVTLAWTTDVTSNTTALHNIKGIKYIYIDHQVLSDVIRVFGRVSLDDNSTVELSGTDVVRVNSSVVRILATACTNFIDIYCINPAQSRLNPAKLIDTASETVVTDVPLWHPAIGIHSHLAIHNVDLQTSTDPARYQFTLDSNPALTWHRTNAWNHIEVGTTWLDTSHLVYVPYYDDVVFPAINDRLSHWGDLTPWGDAKVYVWMQSTNSPAKFVGGGQPKLSTFYRARSKISVAVDVSSNRLTLTSFSRLIDSDVVLISGAKLPANVASNIKYAVTNVIGHTFQLLNLSTDTIVTFVDTGLSVTLTPEFNVDVWIKHSLNSFRLSAPVLVRNIDLVTATSVSPTVTWTPTYITPTTNVAWKVTDTTSWIGVDNVVDVYVNGVIRDRSTPAVYDTVSGLYTAAVAGPLILNEFDLIDIVRLDHILSKAEIAFDPNIKDDPEILIQWASDYEYTTRLLTLGSNIVNQTPTIYYYFWVQDSTIRPVGDAAMSVSDIAQQLMVIPSAHMVLQAPKANVEPYATDPYGQVRSIRNDDDMVKYRDVIVRKISNYITDDDRYILQFTRDLALRDQLIMNGVDNNLKNKHQEWLMFREKQTSTIDRVLWDRLTESLAGFTLSDNSVRVPSSVRTIYDARNGTETQYGMGQDQSFVNKSLGISTVLAYLRDGSRDFNGIDINVFFSHYNFDTPNDIVITMNAIYNSFTAEHVNSIWFSALQDALSTRAQFTGLMKTSWIALHGIRLLEVGGLFD